jgi:hypothetical protein
LDKVDESIGGELFVSESKDSNTACLDQCIPYGVSSRCPISGVNWAVKLDRKTQPGAIEIDDERPDDLLAPEPETQEPPAA